MPVDTLRAEIARALHSLGVEDAGEIVLERPRNPDHGDWATNVALQLAKPLRKAPRQIAEELVDLLDVQRAGVSAAEIAGPGFINFRLAAEEVQGRLLEIAEADAAFGRSDAGRGEAVNVEFVSANPTGPLHIGHGRQAALGDAISSLLAWTGWKVQREYYYNDAGEQINRLARSTWARYQQEQGREVDFPEDGYQGDYVTDIARELAAAEGDRWADDDSPEALEAMRRFAVRVLMTELERDLDTFRVEFDEFYLESSLYEEGHVESTISRLRESGLVYEKDGALWLRTTEYGDDKDRVMVKSTGHPTYFLPDVAYHVTKWERGFHRAINVQGADHHGTIARVRAGLRALGHPEGYPEYVLHQMVLVIRGGAEVKFSKRAGDYVTLRELFDEVGVDVARYFFLMRRPEAQLTFDLDLALDQSDKNPVYKVQYAHARMCSIARKGGVELDAVDPASADLSLLERDSEIGLIKEIARFPEVIEEAAAQRAPHSVCAYLESLAGMINSWYHEGNDDPSLRVIGVEDDLMRARMVLVRAIRIVLRNGLAVLGVSAPERMEREQAIETAEAAA